VSIKSAGPKGKISMDFRTGSVVVPKISEVRDNFCPAMALKKLDFPAFLLPKNAM